MLVIKVNEAQKAVVRKDRGRKYKLNYEFTGYKILPKKAPDRIWNRYGEP